MSARDDLAQLKSIVADMVFQLAMLMAENEKLRQQLGSIQQSAAGKSESTTA